MNNRHYGSSVPFEWIRKTIFKVDKPYALGFSEWDEWYDELKTTRPIAYWFTETLPRWLEKPGVWFIDPFRDAKIYFVNRFIDRTHYLHTDLKPGEWHEFPTRMLHGLFTELVDFVEIESAWGHHGNDEKKYNVPFWRRYQWLRWGRWRCVQAGIDHLNWAMHLDDDEPDSNPFDTETQSGAARETMILYTWWKEIRPARKEVYGLVGLDDFNEQMTKKYGKHTWKFSNKMTPTEGAEYTRLHELADKIDKERNAEDEACMIRLIKLRHKLWT